MFPDLSTIDTKTVAIWAIGATILSALAAASASLTVALVNHWAARRLAREQARREILTKLLEPVGRLADTRPGEWVAVLTALSDGDEERFNTLFKPLDNVPLASDNLSHFYVMTTEPLLMEEMAKFYLTNVACRELVLQCKAGERTPTDAVLYVLGPHALVAQSVRGLITNFLIYGRSTMRFFHKLRVLRAMKRSTLTPLNIRHYQPFDDVMRALTFPMITTPQEAIAAARRSIDTYVGPTNKATGQSVSVTTERCAQVS